jgi:hypothetical protein
MKKFWQTKKFKKLQNVWNEKLKASGFNDAESEYRLKLPADHCYCWARTKEERENKLRYYVLLGQHFHAEEFQDAVDALVMERRAEGIKIKHISEELRQLGERCHRETIRYIIRRYEIKWGIKKS